MNFRKSVFYMPKQSQLSYWENEWSIRDVEKQIASAHKKAWWPDLERILNEEVTGDDLIVEAGCGMGQFVYVLHHMDKKVVGVDVTEQAVQHTRSMFPELDIRVQDIRKLEFADESIKLMLSLGVLEHFEEGPDHALMEASRVMKKGGVLFLTIPYNNRYRRRLEPFRRMKRWFESIPFVQKMFSLPEKVFYQYTYSEEEIKELLESYGFVVERTLLHHTHVAAKEFSNSWWFRLKVNRSIIKPVSATKIKKWAKKQESKNPDAYAHIALYVARKV